MHLTLSCKGTAAILYTLDGSEPTPEHGLLYESGIELTAGDSNAALAEALAKEAAEGTVASFENIPTATVVRARTVMPDGTYGRIRTNTYFLGQQMPGPGCVVVSIAISPEHLLDHESGIFAKGATWEARAADNEARVAKGAGWSTVGNYSNSGDAWQRPAHIEVFSGNMTLLYKGDCNIGTYGGTSRSFAQKGLRVALCTSKNSGIGINLFPGNADHARNPITRYCGFALRNGGNDREYLKFRDSMFQKLIADAAYDIATQASLMAIVFINGAYYGAMCLIEDYCEGYFSSHYGLDPQNVICYEEDQLAEGVASDSLYRAELMSYVSQDLSDDATYADFENVADTRSMAQYYAAEIYFGNYDWNEGKNYGMWRAREKDPSTPYGDTRWRWVLYDFEFGAGLYDRDTTNPSFNSLKRAVEKCPLFASALQNERFRSMFLFYLRDMSEKVMHQSRVLAELKQWCSRWTEQLRLTHMRFRTGTLETLSWDANCIIGFFDSRAEHMERFVEEMLDDYRES